MVVPACELQAVGEQDGDHVEFGNDPEARAAEAGDAEASVGSVITEGGVGAGSQPRPRLLPPGRWPVLQVASSMWLLRSRRPPGVRPWSSHICRSGPGASGGEEACVARTPPAGGVLIVTMPTGTSPTMWRSRQASTIAALDQAARRPGREVWRCGPAGDQQATVLGMAEPRGIRFVHAKGPKMAAGELSRGVSRAASRS